MSITPYEARHYNGRWWVVYRGQLLGAYSANRLRAYVFPLYTPAGVLVLQESPVDHPHHQGIWVGLNIDGYDLWNAGSGEVPRHRQESLTTFRDAAPSLTSTSALFAHRIRWASADGEELVLEDRVVQFSGGDEYTLVRWRSEFSHPTRPVSIEQTKEAGIGVRVPPHWETIFGGRIRDATGAEGETACFDSNSPWLNVEGPAGHGATAGVVLLPAPQSEHCPWFTRDYGVHTYNPARHHPIALGPGERLVWEAYLLTYDGARSIDQVHALVGAIGGT